MKDIVIVIGENGEVSIDMKGWKGQSCDKIAQKLARAVGSNVKTTKKTEYYATETKPEQHIDRGF